MKPAQATFSLFISIIIFLGSTTLSFLLTIILGLFGIYGLIVLAMLYMLFNLCIKDNKLYNKSIVAGMIIGTGIGLMSASFLGSLYYFR